MHILGINLVGAFLAVKYAARIMVPAGHGSIICTASVAGLRSGAGGPPYSASKAGVISLVQTSANDFAGTGVRVNAICPGLIETGMTRTVFETARAKGSERKIGQLNPLRRGGVPMEIAHAALFLASDDASYVNGQALAVDGGRWRAVELAASDAAPAVAALQRIEERGTVLDGLQRQRLHCRVVQKGVQDAFVDFQLVPYTALLEKFG